MGYFFNRPYMDELVWDSLYSDRLNPEYEGLLDPLDTVEDYRYENGLGPEKFKGKSEDRFRENELLDGDHMVNDWKDGQLWGTRWYEAGHHLSVFDRDGDGRVENPQIDDPINLDRLGQENFGEYTTQQKITHTEIHEMFHSLGVIGHSADELCLMNNYSNNWSRAGHVSTWAMEQVQVNNGTEY